ncbi:MAG: hypothetical protein HXY22_04055 [Alphaproteobacteria bacterium]|nr:hypothetical protein [Alphaproteobacteria bacterium]
MPTASASIPHSNWLAIACPAEPICVPNRPSPGWRTWPTHALIWAEGSAYIIGVERALRDWRPLLRPGGVLVFSDMVWRTNEPQEALRAFWASEYPAMTRASVRLEQAKRAGYRLLGHFDMGREAMETYYRPLEASVTEMQARLAGSRVLDDLRAELAAYHACDGIVSFEMFVLQIP